ncbi:restriction endonuclease [Streptomyces sp. NPDC089919]|uniref:nSTAND3 domain-containing NTPase n=1 Tax=Streptomyces sp. NPDC089919 TaxID=3155188 RepID=UPI00342AF41F
MGGRAESFDLEKLTDFDFEAVCKDLFEAEFGHPLEIFAAGPDGGVDLRYLKGDGPALVIQCKYWATSGGAALIRHVRTTEAPKVARLSPGRYVLATSVDLTPARKDELYGLLRPYALSPGDVYGRRELDALLRKHEHVVRRHLRLWLTSASVLSALLSQRIATRSQALLDRVAETLRTYAETGSRDRAVGVLEDRRVCVVAGAPGVGKTTLAHVLCAQYASQGYEVVEISQDADEANSLWDEGRPQLFHYDDFLGQTTLGEKLGKNEDARLLSLMDRVSRSPGKRFLLTTREYILAQAKQRYERLDQQRFDPLTCVLDIGEYTYRARASILYNHLAAAALPDAEKSPFADRTVYEPIVRHPNFNPRVIAATIAERAAFGSAAPGLARELADNLDDPSRVWHHIVTHQLSASDVALLRLAFTFTKPVRHETLLAQWTAAGRPSRSFRTSLAILDGTLLRTRRTPEGVSIELHNPSIRDYLRDAVAADPDEIASLLSCIRLYEQFRTLSAMLTARNGEQLAGLLTRHADVLTIAARAAIRQGQEPALHRALFFIEFGERLSVPPLSELGWQIALDRRYARDWYDADCVVALVKRMSSAEEGSLRRAFLPEMVEQVITEVCEDLSDWDFLRSAWMVLQQLAEIAPETRAPLAADEVDRRTDDYARQAVASWADPDAFRRHDLAEMRDIIDYCWTLEIVSEETWRAAEIEVHLAEEQRHGEATQAHRTRPTPAPSPHQPFPTPAEIAAVATMMSTLPRPEAEPD